MKPRQKVHSIFLLSDIIFFVTILALSIIGTKNTVDQFEKIYLCSKILTIKKIIKENAKNLYPLQNLKSKIKNKNYMELLKDSIKNTCKNNYKECGILDSMGNIMCIPVSETCPINEISIDKLDINDYSFHKDLFKNYILYYNNKRINNTIVVKMVESYINPRYIPIENFIFDYDAFKKYRKIEIGPIFRGYSAGDGGYDGSRGGNGWSGGGGSGGGGGVGGGGGGWRNLDAQNDYGDTKTKEYIFNKIQKEAKDDIYYKKIDDKLYIRNYIGFETYEGIKTFVEYDFEKEYKTYFPNITVIYIGYFGLLPFLILVFFRFRRLCYKDNPYDKTNNFCVCLSKFLVFICYFSFFIGYFIYIFIRFVEVLINSKKIFYIKKN